MKIDNQIRYWAQIVSESLDESDDALVGGSQIDSKIKELENIANQIKPKLQNALKTQRDKIPQDKLKTLIIKLIQIDPDSVSEEDYKVVGLVKSEYMDMIKDVGDSLEDITKESNELEISEGIGDFFGKLFNTKAYQQKLADEKFVKRHPLSQVAKNYGSECQFAFASFYVDYMGGKYSGYVTVDVLSFSKDIDKDRLSKAFDNTPLSDEKNNFTVIDAKGNKILISKSLENPQFVKFVEDPNKEKNCVF